MIVSRTVCGMLGITALLCAGAALPASAGDVTVGKKKAIQCATCHGLDGKSKLPEAPNLAGQTESYITIALNAYKSGERKNELMSLVAPTLRDEDIADLAAYYSSLGCGAAPGQ